MTDPIDEKILWIREEVKQAARNFLTNPHELQLILLLANDHLDALEEQFDEVVDKTRRGEMTKSECARWIGEINSQWHEDNEDPDTKIERAQGKLLNMGPKERLELEETRNYVVEKYKKLLETD
jgi:polyhydroxyalkanoate synthesis regulator phasin